MCVSPCRSLCIPASSRPRGVGRRRQTGCGQGRWEGCAHSPLPFPSVESGTAAFLLKGTLLVDLGPHPHVYMGN